MACMNAPLNIVASTEPRSSERGNLMPGWSIIFFTAGFNGAALK